MNQTVLCINIYLYIYNISLEIIFNFSPPPPTSSKFLKRIFEYSIHSILSIFHTTFHTIPRVEKRKKVNSKSSVPFQNEMFNEMLNVSRPAPSLPSPPPPHLHLSAPFRLFLSVFESRTFKDVWSDRWMDHDTTNEFVANHF